MNRVQTFLPPNVHILAYKTISINSQASALDGIPLICGTFLYINDPLGDQSDTVGVKCNLKDVPPSIMAIASDQMERIRQSERDSRVKWVTDQRVYVREPTFTVGMVKILDPDIAILGSLPIPADSVNHGVSINGGLNEQLQSEYNLPNDEDVVMGFPLDPSVGTLSHVQGTSFVDAQNQDVLGHNGSAVPARVKGIKQETGHANGFAASSSSSTTGHSHKEHKDGAFDHKKIKYEDEN
ncbi:hypothetical protein TWF506_009519 [Arthrobotrys conoides]|uniref:Uncharacterized protein n=1 Tax=Arthrobotrys conoides TaxID=74498 RepID=A0AAN8N9L2_9PEZI